MIENSRVAKRLTRRALARHAHVNEGRLGLVLKNKAHLTREQAFFVGLALGFTPPEMEKLALLLVFARAKSPLFKKHVSIKLSKIEEMIQTGSWTNYMSSTLNQIEHDYQKKAQKLKCRM